MPVHAMQHHVSASHAHAQIANHRPAWPQAQCQVHLSTRSAATAAQPFRMFMRPQGSKGAGTVPVEWGTQLPALEDLYLAQSNFTGADAGAACLNCHPRYRSGRVHSCMLPAFVPICTACLWLPVGPLRLAAGALCGLHSMTRPAARAAGLLVRVISGLTGSCMPPCRMGSKQLAVAPTGPFPAWGAAAGSFRQLGTLDLSENSLTGSLPASLSQCACLSCLQSPALNTAASDRERACLLQRMQAPGDCAH